MNAELTKAFELAKKARSQAYSPYSKFQVGACFKLQGKDQYVTGCNVENASFGATVCAERVAVWNWVSQLRKEAKLEFLVLVTDTQDPVATPCGMCLQVLTEFTSMDFPVHIANLAGIKKSVTLKDLLPMAFKFPVAE
jgi:homotetrameric cytidine deaminase